MRALVARMASTLLPALVLAACTAAPARPAADDPRSVLLPATQLTALLHTCSRPAPEAQGSWPVTPAQLARLQLDLPRLAELPDYRAAGLAAPSSYRRQLLGVWVNGKALIYINALPGGPGEPPQWRQQALQACDGGPQFWGVLYDPASGRFSQFATNGGGRPVK